MKEETRKGLCPQITQMDADKEIKILLLRICVNLRQSAGNSGFRCVWPRCGQSEEEWKKAFCR